MTPARLTLATLPCNRAIVQPITSGNRHPMRLSGFASLIAFTAASVLLAGCAGFTTSGSPAAPSQISLAGIHGTVFGGQQPIVGATIQLYQAGTTGYGQGATALIANGGVLTLAGGVFNISGLYTCAPGSQVYITSSGGNPGGGTNANATLIAGLGLCDNAPNIPFITLDEVTTVGTVWALAPFMNGLNIGAPPSNQSGLVSAFADINTLVTIVQGGSPGPAAPAGSTVPVQEIYALADSLGACVNSTGAGGGGFCDTLFSYTTPSGGTAPADTVSAAINIARYPTQNAANILKLATPSPPFATTFKSANDLTLAVTYTGSGLSAPTAAAVDASGNVWITNSGNNSVTELSHAGAPQSGAGFTAGALNVPSAIAIDTVGNAWIANSGNSTLTELTSSGTNATNSPFSGGGLSTPTSVAIDGMGNVWLSNSGNNSASEFSSAGTTLSGSTGYLATGLATPIGLAVNPH
jgi:hypothetical protein